MAVKKTTTPKKKAVKDVRPWKTDVDFLHDVCKQNDVFDHLDTLDEWIAAQKKHGKFIYCFLLGCFLGTFTLAVLHFLGVLP